MRVKRGVTARARHKKILKATKGMTLSRRNSSRLGKQGMIKALQYAYRDRRNKKRTMRGLWTTRINAAVREHGLSYSVFMNKVKTAGVTIDRKIMAELAVNEPAAFAELVKKVQ
jgi:large subunit ribosomal protein L20